MTTDEESKKFIRLADELFTALLEDGVTDDPKFTLLFSVAFAQKLREKGWELCPPS